MDNNSRRYADRQSFIAAGFLLMMLLFVIRLFQLQIVESDYKKWADSNAFLKRTLYPARGMIYDRNGKLLVYNQPAYDMMFIPREMAPFDTAAFCEALKITKEWMVKRIADVKNPRLNPGYSSYVPQVFMSQLSAQDYGMLQEKLYKFYGFYIRPRTLRDYNHPSAAHILGTVGEVNKQDLAQDEYYVQGDYAGRSGLEKSYEHILRGEKGVEVLLRDAHGRLQGQYQDGKMDERPQSGKNLTLSVNIDLQAYGEMLMQNKKGSIVMIEPATGEILCMVSAPSYDPRQMTGRSRGRKHQELTLDPNKPLFDRSVMGTYPPGSTFKPAQGLIFLQEEVIDTRTAYTCYHGYPYTGGKPACHGHASPLSIVSAIANSCNSFFCWGLHEMLDNRHRYPTIQEGFEVWKQRIVAQGYGYALGVDLPDEKRGYIPNKTVYDNIYHKWWTSSTIISIAIGQGEVTATPLQMCNLAATIANRGYFVTPHVVQSVEGAAPDERFTGKRFTGINTEHYETVAEGMRESVIRGTCWSANIPGIEVCGKTGTAENPHGKDHSAFIGFAPYRNPQVAIAVYVENGGWGANYGVPIGKLMMERYLRGSISPASQYTETAMLLSNLLSQ
jgi:penicillin-binding protein 2